MLLWNYLITPLYMKCTREQVVELLLPAFLPFNVLKGGLNAAFTFLLYKPVVTALRKSGLVEMGSAKAESKEGAKSGKNIGMKLVALVVIAACILWVLVLKGII